MGSIKNTIYALCIISRILKPENEQHQSEAGMT